MTCFYNSALSLFPNFITTYVFCFIIRVSQRNLCFYLIEIQCTEYNLDNIHYFQEFFFHLIWTTEDMCIILSETAYTSQSVQLAALFIAVYGPKLCITQRKVFI